MMAESGIAHFCTWRATAHLLTWVRTVHVVRVEAEYTTVTEPARGHHDRVKMAAAGCSTVMAGHVPAIRSESPLRLVAGTLAGHDGSADVGNRDFVAAASFW
jgi:hypothetical protein